MASPTAKKKILVAVTGMSPQIVTETVYALYQERQWIPEQIHVLTTSLGARNIQDALLGDNGYLARLCRDYHLPMIRFDESCIHVIMDEHQQSLADIRTPEQNSCAADMIMQFIHNICADPETEVHVSIAGGRKSMGFYIGYALSLFGRAQDSLSHVLVEEAFEQNPDFFYPTIENHLIKTLREGYRDTATAKVMLAEIPFVRMRLGKPELHIEKGWRFMDVVNKTQRELSAASLILLPAQQTLLCNGLSVRLSEQQFAVYLAMVNLHLSGRKVIRHSAAQADKEGLIESYWDSLLKVRRGRVEHLTLSERKEAKARLQEDIWRILQECRSKIHARLNAVLGGAAEQFYIVSEGKNNRKSYGLSLPVDCIEIK